MSTQIFPKRKPGRIGVQYEAVAAAADSLLHEGINPTTEKVLARLPSGSQTKVCEHMRQWWAARESGTSANLPEYKIDDAVLEALRREIHAKVEGATAEHKRHAEEAKQDREAVVRESRQVAEELEQAQLQNESLMAELATRQGALSELRARLDKAEEHEHALRNEIERIGLEAAADRNRIAHAAMAEKLISDLNLRLSASETRRTESEARLAEAMAQNGKIQELLNMLTAQFNRLLTHPLTSTSTGEANGHHSASDVVAFKKLAEGVIDVGQPHGKSESTELVPDPASEDPAKRGRGMRVATARKGRKQVSAAAAVLDATKEMIRIRGPLAISEIRTELSKGSTPRCSGKTLRSLSAILSKARSVSYSRTDGLWRLNDDTDGAAISPAR